MENRRTDFDRYKNELDQNGFAIIDAVFTNSELSEITTCIEEREESLANTKKSKDLFAIRKIFTELPGIKDKILIGNIKSIIKDFFGPDYFIIKGLYFNKPSLSNWFVAYHQDRSVSVSNKIDSPLYKGWTIKDNQFGVQPPVTVLESIYTVRIHLDDCTGENGALHVIPGSHKKGVNTSQPALETEVLCEVPRGGIMIMRPLLLHASHKSTVTASRRVLHIEFCNRELPESVYWAEKELIF